MSDIVPQNNEFKTYLEGVESELTSIKENFADYEKNTDLIQKTKTLLSGLYSKISENENIDQTIKDKIKEIDLETFSVDNLEKNIIQIQELKNLTIELDLVDLQTQLEGLKTLTATKDEVDELNKEVGENESDEDGVKKEESEENEIEKAQTIELDNTVATLLDTSSVDIDLTTLNKETVSYTETGTKEKVSLGLKLAANGKFYSFEKIIGGKKKSFRLWIDDGTITKETFADRLFRNFQSKTGLGGTKKKRSIDPTKAKEKLENASGFMTTLKTIGETIGSFFSFFKK